MLVYTNRVWLFTGVSTAFYDQIHNLKLQNKLHYVYGSNQTGCWTEFQRTDAPEKATLKLNNLKQLNYRKATYLKKAWLKLKKSC